MLSVVLPLAAGAALLLLALGKDRAVPPADAAVAAPTETADQPEKPKEVAALTAIALPPPPAAPRTAEVKPSPQTPPVPEAKPREIVPLQPKVAEAEPPAPTPVPPREIVPLPARQETPPAEPVVEIRPMKAAPRDQATPPQVVHPLPSEAPSPRLPATEETVAKAKAADASPAEPETVHVSAAAGGAVAQEGRALLRLLEHGSGPAIEIAWPSGTARQTRLYETLARCYGMRSIVMDGQGNLYVAEGARGHKWDLNLDRFSGFVRQPAGFVAAEERRQAEAIRRYHAMNGTAGLVRIFPRAVDAVLLGGLQQILGDGYRDARAIHALYRMDGNRLFVENIERDGVAVTGRIAFTSISRGTCGG